MPQLNDVVKNRDSKKFVKKNYRPWDLSGNSDNLLNNQDETKNEYVENQISTQKPTPNISTVVRNIPIQLDNNTDNIKIAIRDQIGNHGVTCEEQTDNIKKTEEVTNGELLDNQLDNAVIHNRIQNLSGLQKLILEFMVEICSEKNSLDTGPVETNIICLYIKANNGVVKMSLKRLIDKGFLIRKKGKVAKGGYVNFSIPKEIFAGMIEHRKNHHRYNNPVSMVTYLRQQLDNKELHSSSYLNNKTTTVKGHLSPEWEQIDFELLSEIGFTKNQIRQLVDTADPVVVQESIKHFSFGLTYNQKLKKYEDPLNVLMGVLRKGQAWFEKDYRSPKEIAQQQIIENKKIELERKFKLEDEAYKLSLEQWKRNLTPVEIEKIVANKNKIPDLTPQPAKLSIFFKENIWPEKKAEYFIE